jgi:hypothetical protein
LLYIPGQLKDLERHKDVSTSAPSWTTRVFPVIQ